MKNRIYIYIAVVIFSFVNTEAVNGSEAIPKFLRFGKSKSVCDVQQSRFTKNDLVVYRVGIVAGQNVSTIKSKGSSIQDEISRLVGGLAAQIVWPMGFVLQPEILYSQKGCIIGGSATKYNVDYLEIPVKAMYSLQITTVKPFAFVAPYAAYVINMAQDGNVYTDDTLSDQINKFDYGIGVGAGFDVWRFQVSFRYSWGFAQVIDQPQKARNNVFTASAGIFF